MSSPRRVNRGPAAAAENRAAILAAARTVFDEHGPSAPLLLISNTAGVSSGVLYRHFPHRKTLIQAVFDQDIEALEKLAADPDCSLDEFLAAFLDSLVDCTAFLSNLRYDQRDPDQAASSQRVHGLLAAKLATDTGDTLRPGTTADDLLLAIGLIAALLTKTAEPLRRAVADASWHLVMRGLRNPELDGSATGRSSLESQGF